MPVSKIFGFFLFKYFSLCVSNLLSWFPNTGCTHRCGGVKIVWYWKQTSAEYLSTSFQVLRKGIRKMVKDVLPQRSWKWRWILYYLCPKYEAKKLNSKSIQFLSCQTLTFDQKGIQFVWIWMPAVCKSGKIEIQDTFYRFQYLFSDLKSGK